MEAAQEKKSLLNNAPVREDRQVHILEFTCAKHTYNEKPVYVTRKVLQLSPKTLMQGYVVKVKFITTGCIAVINICISCSTLIALSTHLSLSFRWSPQTGDLPRLRTTTHSRLAQRPTGRLWRGSCSSMPSSTQASPTCRG